MKTFYVVTDKDGARHGHTYAVGEITSVSSSGRKKKADLNNPKTVVYANSEINHMLNVELDARLFVVTGRPVTNDPRTGDYGFRQVRVLEELPFHVLLGPMGEDLLALAEQASNTSDADIEKMVVLNARAAGLVSESGVTWFDIYSRAQSIASTVAQIFNINWNLIKKVVVDPSYTMVKTTAEFTALGLATKHLIGVLDYGEEHYKSLTAIWRNTLGVPGE